MRRRRVTPPVDLPPAGYCTRCGGRRWMQEAGRPCGMVWRPEARKGPDGRIIPPWGLSPWSPPCGGVEVRP